MRAIRVCVLSVLLMGIAAVAGAAQPRLVRVIWDVGGGRVYYKAEPLIGTGQSSFIVPKDAAAAKEDGFQSIGPHTLQVNDVVRVFIVNYNPVSHVWDSSSTAVQIAKQPSVVPALLNAAVLAITGLAKGPEAAPPTKMFMRDIDLPPTDPCTSELRGVRTALTGLNGAEGNLYAAMTAVIDEAHKIKLSDLAKALADIPTDSTLSAIFDDHLAWNSITTDVRVFGKDFDATTKTLADRVTAAHSGIETENTAMLVFDQAVVKLGAPTKGCADEAKALIERRDNIAEFVKEMAGADSPLVAVMNAFDGAKKLWSGFRSALSTSTWTDEAIEIDLKDPLAEASVVRVDAIFASPDKTSLTKTQRSIVLGMKPNIPILVISAGVGFNNFQFKTLGMVKIPVSQPDGTTVVKNQLTIVDDTSWNPIVPVWLENVRVASYKDVGFYGTFGTTPDRNIFQNAIVGGSVYVASWRTTFTVGMITARGYSADDLAGVKKSYSDSDGFALPDVAKDNVLLPPAGWKKSPFASITFTLVKF